MEIHEVFKPDKQKLYFINLKKKIPIFILFMIYYYKLNVQKKSESGIRKQKKGRRKWIENKRGIKEDEEREGGRMGMVEEKKAG